MNNKCERYKEINFETLDLKNMDYIKAQAELEKEQKITQEKINSFNRQLYYEFTSLNKMAEMYGLNKANEPTGKTEKCPLNKENYFENNRNKIMAILLTAILITLAIGISPSGEWWETLQTSYVELLVDLFRMGLLIVGGIFVYKLFKK